MQERPKVGVAVIIIQGNKVLLGKRKGAHGVDTWAFPGGHLEFGETLEQCANREVMEETSLVIKNIHVAAVTNDIFKEDHNHYITIFMISTYKSGKAKVCEPEKCEQWQWYEWGNLPQTLFLPVQNLL